MPEISAVLIVCLLAAAGTTGNAQDDLYENLGVSKDDNTHDGIGSLIRELYPVLIETQDGRKRENTMGDSDNSGEDPLYAFFIICGIPLSFIVLICVLYVVCKLIRSCTTNSVGDQVDRLLAADSSQYQGRESCFMGRRLSGCVSYRANPELHRSDDLESATLMPILHDATGFSIHIVSSKDWDLPPSYEEVMLSAVSCAAPAYDECFPKS